MLHVLVKDKTHWVPQTTQSPNTWLKLYYICQVWKNYYILPSYSSKLYISLHAGEESGSDRGEASNRPHAACTLGQWSIVHREPMRSSLDNESSTEPSRRQRDEHNNRFSFYTTIHTHTYTCDNPGIQNQLPSLNQVLQYTARRQKITARTSWIKKKWIERSQFLSPNTQLTSLTLLAKWATLVQPAIK